MQPDRPLPKPINATSQQQLEAQMAAWRALWRILLVRREGRAEPQERAA